MRFSTSWVTCVFVAAGAVCLLPAAACRSLGVGWGSFNEAACPGERFSLTDAFVPTYDYAELRSSDAGAPARVLGQSGEKCRTAKNRPKCEADLAAATATEGWSNGSGRMPGFHYLVLTKEDRVLVVDQHTSRAGEALAPIDTPSKAAAVAAVTYGIFPDCRNSVRRAGSAFEVHLKSDSCFGPREEIIRVFAAGNMELVKEEHGAASCVGAQESRETDGRRRGT